MRNPAAQSPTDSAKKSAGRRREVPLQQLAKTLVDGHKFLLGKQLGTISSIGLGCKLLTHQDCSEMLPTRTSSRMTDVCKVTTGSEDGP
jgi:hypothetical protein